MKKKELCNKVLFPEFSNKKLLLMLNWTIILTFLLVLEVSANSYSQNVKVDLDFNDVTELVVNNNLTQNPGY